MFTRFSNGRLDIFVDLALLTGLVAACFGSRVDDLSVRGEESRWATVAMEMRRTGDWVVPRQQGEPFLSRPPMGSWLIAIAAEVRGECDAVAVRLPSILAVLATTLLIYGYARSFLGRSGSVAAAAGFATMPEILQMGRLGESDAVFTAFLGGAFIVWQWGQSRRWPAAVTWSLAYFLLGCATLTKGPQAPVYFGATVGLDLIASRQWRRLISLSHLVGLSAFALTLGAWLAPYYSQMGWNDTCRIVTGDSTDRFGGWTRSDFLGHLLQYPLEIIGCTAPLSYLLLGFTSRRFRDTLGNMASPVRFFAISLLVSFPTCWITPGGQTRYLMPLYPGVALLAAIVIERLAAPTPWLRVAFGALRGITIVFIAAFAVAIGYLPQIIDVPELQPWKQSAPFALALLATAATTSVLLPRRGPFSPSASLVGVLAVPAFLGLSYAGAVVSQLGATSERAAERIELVVREMPIEAELFSLGPAHHKFAYHVGRPIRLLHEVENVPPGAWFSYTSHGGRRRELPFEMEVIAVISMDRNRSSSPQVATVVARRVGPTPGMKHLAFRQP